MVESKKYTYKIVVVGDPSVGKTSLIRRYADKKFDESYLPTIGADFTIKQFDLKKDDMDVQVILTIWDMGGHKGFDRVRDLYYPGANAGLVVFDLTEKETFEHLESWLADIYAHCGTEIPLIILANKNDLPNKTISKNEMKKLALNKKLEIFETSAKSGENVEKAFELIAEKCLETYDISSRMEQE